MAKNKLDVADGSVKIGEGTSEEMTAVTSLNDPHPSPLPPAGEGTNEEGSKIIDEFHGQGGSYVVDDATQTRVQNK